jgi:hypothetical protein
MGVMAQQSGTWNNQPRTQSQEAAYKALGANDRRKIDFGLMRLDDGFGGGVGAFSGGAGPGAGVASLSSMGITQGTMDPWSRYRSQAGDILATQMDPSNDPSNIYRSKLQGMVDGTADFETNDPSYKFRFDQGQKATERSLAARGLLNSGNAAAELQQYGQQAASQEYGAQFSRLLQGLSGVSQQYDTQQQRLMKMAGVDINPNDFGRTASSFALGAQSNANDFALGSGRLQLDAWRTQQDMQMRQQELRARQQSGGSAWSQTEAGQMGLPMVNRGSGPSMSDRFSAESGQWWAQREAPGGGGVGSRSWY